MTSKKQRNYERKICNLKTKFKRQIMHLYIVCDIYEISAIKNVYETKTSCLLQYHKKMNIYPKYVL